MLRHCNGLSHCLWWADGQAQTREGWELRGGWSWSQQQWRGRGAERHHESKLPSRGESFHTGQRNHAREGGTVQQPRQERNLCACLNLANGLTPYCSKSLQCRPFTCIAMKHQASELQDSSHLLPRNRSSDIEISACQSPPQRGTHRVRREETKRAEIEGDHRRD